jgi:hypothetical protein
MAFELLAEDWERALGLGVESTLGTWVTPTQWIAGKCDLKPSSLVKVLGVNDFPIGSQEETHVQVAQRKCDGTISIQVHPGLETFLFGAPTAEAAGGICVPKYNDPLHMPSFSVTELQGAAVDPLYYKGICVNKLSIKSKVGENLVLDLDCIGVDEDTTSRTAPVPDYANIPAPYIHEEITLTEGSGQNAVSLVEIDDLEYSEDFGLREDQYGGSLTRQEMSSQHHIVTMKATLWRSTNVDALVTAYRSKAAIGLTGKWARSTGNIQAVCAKCLITEPQITPSKCTFDIRAFADLDAETPAVVWTAATAGA